MSLNMIIKDVSLHLLKSLKFAVKCHSFEGQVENYLLCDFFSVH